MGAWGWSPVHGLTKNPTNPKYTTAGSSSGTAAGIKVGMAACGLGSDTGGSGRMPAECCGVVGMRPSRGRYPAGGVVPCDVKWDTPTPMARTVADLAILDAVMAGDPVANCKPAPLVGVGVCTASDLYGDAAEGACAARDLALAAFAAAGAVCNPAGVEFKGPQATFKHDVHLDWHEKGFDDYIASHPTLTLTTGDVFAKSFYPHIQSFMNLKGRVNVKTLPAEDVDAAVAKFETELELLTAQYTKMFEDNDVEVIMTPTISGTPREAFTDDEYRNLANAGDVLKTMGMILGAGSSMHLYNNISVPSLALPTKAVHRGIDGAPMTVSVCLWGKPGSDQRLLQIAMALELALEV